MCKNIMQHVRKTVGDFCSDLGLLVKHKNKMRTALFCVIMQRVVVISCRRFGTTYCEDGPDMLCRNIGNKLPLLAV